MLFFWVTICSCINRIIIFVVVFWLSRILRYFIFIVFLSFKSDELIWNHWLNLFFLILIEVLEAFLIQKFLNCFLDFIFWFPFSKWVSYNLSYFLSNVSECFSRILLFLLLRHIFDNLIYIFYITWQVLSSIKVLINK